MAGSKLVKPGKPYQEFPMFPHASGQWTKKIKGKMWYFGTWDDPDTEFARYSDWIHEIHAGRDPRRTGVDKQVSSDSLTIFDLCNLFMARQESRVKTGAAMMQRPIAKDDSDDALCFLTTHGKPVWWEASKENGEVFMCDNIAKAFKKLCAACQITRSGRGFYSLRRTFETVAGATKDQVAVDYVMGHVDDRRITGSRAQCSQSFFQARMNNTVRSSGRQRRGSTLQGRPAEALAESTVSAISLPFQEITPPGLFS